MPLKEARPLDDTRDIFARHGLRCTCQRTALYDALCSTDSHPTAEELYQMVRPTTSSLSLATVYSTLETFCRVGLALKLPTIDGGVRFDANTDEHVHVRVADSGAIHDVPHDLSRELLDAMPAQILQNIGERLGVRIDGLSIQLVASETPRN